MNAKAFFGFMLFVVIVVVVFVVGLNFITLDTGNNTVAETEGSAITESLQDNSTAIYHKRGSLGADENHRGYRVIISKDKRILEVYKGYQQVVYDRYILDNNEKAYEQFIYALSLQGLSGVAETDDLRGVCATSYLNEFTVTDSSEVVAYQWTTACGNKSTKVTGLDQLFLNQIPDYQNYIGSISF